MTFTSVAQANSKTAEFARLFDLFDRVATRRTRALVEDTSGSEVISTDDIANVPVEFAPVLKKLSTILSSRTRRDEEHSLRIRAASATKLHYHTRTDPSSRISAAENPTPHVDAVEPAGQVGEDENNNIPSFPLGQRYPFTFKLMLHKLYDLEEWAEKVKNTVETSKSQFKPLSEQVQNVVRDATASIKERGGKRTSVRPTPGTSAKIEPPGTTKRTHTSAMSKDATASIKERGEKRSSARPAPGASAKFEPSNSLKQPHSTTTPCEPEASRVLKKRCVGRRKSINGPMSTGVWVYDAAISAAVTEVGRPAVEITLSAPRDAASGAAKSRARHQSLTALEDIHTRDTTKRQVKITVPLQEENAEFIEPRPSPFLQEVIETRSVVKKRSVASVFTSESCKRAAVKRPLCV